MRTVLRVVLINIALVLLVAVAAEAVFGAWFSRDPLDRLNLARGIEVRISPGALYAGGREFTYRRNRWGFRGPEFDPAQVAVVTLGGSTTNQLYLADEHTWQAVLARTLAEQGRPVLVANGGFDGQSTVGHLHALEHWLPNVPGLRPKLIAAYVGINDIHVSGSSIDRLDYSSIWKRLKVDSALVRLWNTAAGMWKAERARLTHAPVDYRAARWTDRPNGTAAIQDAGPYKERLKAMAGLIRGLGAEPLFITQARGDARVIDGRLQGLASADGPNGLDEHGALTRFNAATLDVCAELKVACADLAHEVGFETGDFYDRIHNTPEGAEKIGRWLAGKIGPLLK